MSPRIKQPNKYPATTGTISTRPGLWAAVFSFFLVPAAAHAQTLEIETRVKAELWFRRLVRSLQGEGAGPVFFFLALIACGVLWWGATRFWKGRRRQPASEEESRPQAEPD
jgi:hypothetical protein